MKRKGDTEGKKMETGFGERKKKPVIRAVFQRRNKSNEKNYQIFLNHEIDFRIYCAEVDTDNKKKKKNYEVLKKLSTIVQYC